MKITTINVPTYKVKGYKKVINHFELLKLQTDIANRKKKGNVQVKCITTGNTFTILKSGGVNLITESYKLINSQIKQLTLAMANYYGISSEEFKLLLRGDGLLTVVKMHKDRTGKSLKESKEFIDAYRKSEEFKKHRKDLCNLGQI